MEEDEFSAYFRDRKIGFAIEIKMSKCLKVHQIPGN